jgi:FkbH-like protein
MLDLFSSPVGDILMKRKSLRNKMSASGDLQILRIAVLGGSTTDELINLWELLLLGSGFRPMFQQSDYGLFYESAVYDTQALRDFKPDLVYIHTSCCNVKHKPPLNCDEAALALYVEVELNRYREIWNSLESLGCQTIQNNFETPPHAILGNLDAAAPGGMSRFLMELNAAFVHEIARRPRVLMQDVHGIAATVGVTRWFDWKRYFSYKLLLTAEADLELARSLTSMVKGIFGKSRKVLVLDLDNTLWGGVIGDDGADRIQIGRDTPIAEAYTAFQEYCLSLRERGILLAVCSKNTEEVAQMGFSHPGSILRLEHFSSFKANWEHKPANLLAIANELNLGLDSLVFVDDNPAERAIVEAELPAIAVPDIGSDVVQFADIISRSRYFEPTTLSQEDFGRSSLYADNTKRAVLEKGSADYGEYLASLEMSATIGSFRPAYTERITQLTQKTNQFNLTTLRYTQGEIEAVAGDPGFIGLCGRLKDRFGDNGIISVIVGRKEAQTLHIDLWLMSCRVFKRGMEYAMLDALVDRARGMGVTTILGYYVPTSKNSIVVDLLPSLGFLPHTSLSLQLPDSTKVWHLVVAEHRRCNHHITMIEDGHA